MSNNELNATILDRLNAAIADSEARSARKGLSAEEGFRRASRAARLTLAEFGVTWADLIK